jgi:hypothetical protein
VSIIDRKDVYVVLFDFYSGKLYFRCGKNCENLFFFSIKNLGIYQDSGKLSVMELLYTFNVDYINLTLKINETLNGVSVNYWSEVLQDVPKLIVRNLKVF